MPRGRSYYDDDGGNDTSSGHSKGISFGYKNVKDATAEDDDANCRACSDFKTFMKSKGSKMVTKGDMVQTGKDCPLDKNELGRASWSLLHSIAAYYPETPNDKQKNDVKTLMNSLSNLYPCKECARDLREDLADEPIDTRSRQSLSQWMCRLHNKVNNKLGKELFDCTKVDERWRHGWKDGSCG